MSSMYPIHQYAELFPLLSDDELIEMAHDIEDNGLQKPIVLWDGKVLDGRNRMMACEKVGLVPHVEEWTPSHPEDIEATELEALAYVFSANQERRHLTASQRGMIASAIANMKQSRRKASLPEEMIERSISQVDAAEKLKVSRQTVQRAAKVREHGDETLVDAVVNGVVTLTDAEKIVKRPKRVQRAAVRAVKSKKAPTVAAAAEVVSQNEHEPEGTLISNESQEIDKFLGQLRGALAKANTVSDSLFNAIDAKRDQCRQFAQRHAKFVNLMRKMKDLLEPAVTQAEIIFGAWTAAKNQIGE